MNEVPRETSKKWQRKSEKTSWERKVDFCKRWKGSGLSKSQFCKKEGIPLATFYGWCDRVWPRTSNKVHSKLIPVRLVNKQEEAQEVMVELFLPNQLTARISLPLSRVGSLIKEWCDATTIIR